MTKTLTWIKMKTENKKKHIQILIKSINKVKTIKYYKIKIIVSHQQ